MLKSLTRFFSHSSNGLSEAALIIGFFTLLSQVFGLVRDRLLAHYIGPGLTLDVYYTSFKLPDFLFVSIASLASITVILPFLVERMSVQGKDEARNFLSRVFSCIVILLIVTSIVLFFVMPHIMGIIAPGFDGESLKLLISISRLMLLSPIFMGISNMLGAATQMFRNFTLFALSPVLYNLGIILGILFLYPTFGVRGLTIGVLVGALCHVLIQVPYLIYKRFLPTFTFSFRFRELLTVAKISLPRTLGLAAGSFTLIVFVAMISRLETGAISLFQFSQNIYAIPVALIGASFSVASFPTLVELFQKRSIEHFLTYITDAIRKVIFWTTPFIVLFIVLRAQIVRVIYGTQNLTWEETRLVAALLAILVVAVLAQNLVLLFTRAFYAAAKTRIPLIINIFSEGLKVGGAFFFLGLLKKDIIFTWSIAHMLRISDVSGIELLAFPIAIVIGSIFNALLLFIFLRSHIGRYARGIPRTVVSTIVGGFAMGGSAWVALRLFDPLFSNFTFWGVFLHGLVSGVLGLVVGIAMLRIIHSKDLEEITNTLERKFWKAEVVSETTETGQT